MTSSASGCCSTPATDAHPVHVRLGEPAADEHEGQLAQGYVFQNLNYTYDNVGNITSTVRTTRSHQRPQVGTQVGGPSTQTFQYDDLYQLMHAQGSYQPRGPKTDTYTFDLHYDSIQQHHQ